jgi:hypothetical protein
MELAGDFRFFDVRLLFLETLSYEDLVFVE